ncbi:MAG: peroxiredoxin [Deltaproteobacteria bacterium]|nr:peroxiredoxin [Deltaproteobacteria bacterium]
MLNIGDTAPDFELNDENGKATKLSSFRGQNVVIVFYPLDFSPTCTKELTGMASHKDKYDAAHAKILGISVDSKWTHAAFKKSLGLEASLLADFQPRGKVAQQYGVYMEAAGISKRGTFIVDKDGILRGITIKEPGEMRSEEDYFAQLASCPV